MMMMMMVMPVQFSLPELGPPVPLPPPPLLLPLPPPDWTGLRADSDGAASGATRRDETRQAEGRAATLQALLFSCCFSPCCRLVRLWAALAASEHRERKMRSGVAHDVCLQQE